MSPHMTGTTTYKTNYVPHPVERASPRGHGGMERGMSSSGMTSSGTHMHMVPVALLFDGCLLISV